MAREALLGAVACCGPLVIPRSWAGKNVRREAEGDKGKRETVNLLSLTCLPLIYLLLQAYFAEAVLNLQAAKEVIRYLATKRDLGMNVPV